MGQFAQGFKAEAELQGLGREKCVLARMLWRLPKGGGSWTGQMSAEESVGEEMGPGQPRVGHIELFVSLSVFKSAVSI